MIYIIILSNSTSTPAATGTKNIWTIKHPRNIPIQGKVEIIETMSVHLNDSNHIKLTQAHIPWLGMSDSHVVVGEGNVDIVGAETPAQRSLIQNYDKYRSSTNGIYIACPTDCCSEYHTNEIYSTSHRFIPSNYEIKVTSGYDGSDYKNLSLLMIKIRCTPV